MTSTLGTTMTSSAITLSALDISFFIATLAISVGIGVYFANKNKTLDDYMLGGRDQKVLPVSVSMMTSFISGLTLIGNPAELYYHGMTFSLVVIAMVLSVPFSAFILLPVFHRLESISVFRYLELRYSAWIKRVVSLSFMFQMTLYNAVVLYVPSLSLKSVLGVSDIISVGAVGLSCLVYCTIGGIKAVIWTDFFQAGLMYLALMFICIGGTYEVGGIKKLIEINLEGNRLSLDGFFNFDLHTRHTIFTVCTGSILINVFVNGANQIQVQRALSLPTLRKAQWSQFYCSLFTMSIAIIASYVGLILYATYKDCDPYLSPQHPIDKRDAVLIYYISTHLSWLNGLKGVFVAGIFAATLSTLSSFQNSMAALMLEDFIKPALKSSPLRKKKLTDQQATYLGKIIALLFGIACIALTFVVGRISGLLQVALTLFGSLGAPFLTAFFMGMMTRFTNTIGMLIGMIIGIIFSISIQIYQTFYLPPLLPSLKLSIENCTLYNSTSHLLLLDSNSVGINNHILDNNIIGEENGENYFIYLAKMSYLWLPFISLIITSLVSAIVSILTGGCKQEVDDKYLVSWLHKERSK